MDTWLFALFDYSEQLWTLTQCRVPVFNPFGTTLRSRIAGSHRNSFPLYGKQQQYSFTIYKCGPFGKHNTHKSSYSNSILWAPFCHCKAVCPFFLMPVYYSIEWMHQFIKLVPSWRTFRTFLLLETMSVHIFVQSLYSDTEISSFLNRWSLNELPLAL